MRIKELILSTHTPKTGGNSFLLVLRHICGDKLLVDHPNHGKKNPSEWQDYIVDNEIKAIHGHDARLGRWENYLPPFIAVSWVRDPYTKVIAHFEYAKYRAQFGKAAPYITDIVRRNDFEAYCEIMANDQANYIPINRIDDFGFIGIVEEYKPCLDYFTIKIVGTNKVAMPMENVNPVRGANAKYNPSLEQQKLIEKYNEIDFELYTKAKEKWRMINGNS